MTLENILTVIVVCLINGVSLCLLLKDPGLREEQESGKPLVSRQFIWIYAGFFIALNIAISLFFMYMYESNTMLFSIKRFCILALLWPLGLIDFKTYRIPNRFIITGLIFRALIIIAELFMERQYLLGNLIEEAIATVALVVASLLCCVCIKNSIGYGDIKLFIVMGLLLGLQGIWTAVFVSLIVAFLVAVVLMIIRKKGKKDVVPFAPSIMIGTYISIILTGM